MDIHQDDNLLPNPHPGILIREDFLQDMGITPYRLAKDTGLTQTHVAELLKGKRSLTAKTALLFGKFFGTSPQYFLNMQTRYEMIEAQRSIGDRLKRVKAYEAAS